jgi:predicted nucleic-acid-binding Zn-ribbon protein
MPLRNQPCPICGNTDQNDFELVAMPGRRPTRTTPGIPAVLLGLTCQKCGYFIRFSRDDED